MTDIRLIIDGVEVYGQVIVAPDPEPTPAPSLSPEWLRGYVAGVMINNNAITPNTQIDIGPVVANADDASQMMVLPAGTIDLTAIGENGLDAGIIAANTWYHLFCISKSDGTVSRIASTSVLSPVLPTGYTKKRRIGAMRTNGSAQLIKSRQVGCEATWDVPITDLVSANPGSSAIPQALSVPDGVEVTAVIWFYLGTSDSRRSALITSPWQTNTTADIGTMSSIAAGTTSAQGATQGEFRVRTNTSRQIRFRLDSSSAGTAVIIKTAGWIDHI